MMKSRVSTLVHAPTSELTKRYIIALVAVGLLLVIGQLLLELEFHKEVESTYDLFDAGRAQTLGQTIARTSLQLQHAGSGAEFHSLTEDLRTEIQKLENRINLLRNGNETMERRPESREKVLALLNAIEPSYQTILYHARAILDSAHTSMPSSIAPHVQAILQSEQVFTEGMLRLIHYVIEDSRQQMQWLRYAQLSLFGIVSIIILLSSLYIFRPAVWKVRNTIHNLLETQEILQQSEERFSKIFHSAPLAICITSFSDGKFLVVNASFEELTGCSGTDLIGKMSFDAALGLDKNVLTNFKQEVSARGAVYNAELLLRPQSGNQRHVLVSADSIMLDNKACLIITIKDVTELMHSTRQIEAQEVYYRSLIENSADIITVLNADGTIRYSSMSMTRTLGYKPEVLLGRTFLDLVDQEDRTHLSTLITRATSTPGSVVLVNSFRMLRNSGALLDFEAVISNLLDNSAVEGIVINSRDISDRRKAEARQRLSEEKFATIFQIAPVAITITSFVEDIFLDVNEAYLELTGYTREELLGKTPDEIGLQPAEEQRRSMRKARNDFRRVINFETEIVTKNGTKKHILTSLDHIEIDGRMCILSLMSDISSRKSIEEALRQSEQRFSQVFSSSPAGISITTLEEGRFVNVNESFSVMTGFSREELIGHTTFELGMIKNKANREGLVAQLREQGHFTRVETVLRRKDGDFCCYLSSAELIIVDGQECVLNTGLDITEKKQQEELRQQLEERFSKVFYASPIPILITTELEGDIVDANESYVKLSGYTREELLGKNVIDLNLVTYSENQRNLLKKLADQNSLSNLQGRMHTKTGEQRILLASVERINLGGIPHLLKMAIDVTDRVNTEMALETSEIKFRSLFDLAAIGIGLVDMNANWLLVNQKLADIMGYSSSEFLSPDFPRLTHPDDIDADNSNVRRLLNNEIDEFSLEKRYIRKDGALIWGRTTASLIRSPDGSPLCFIRVVQDITDQKQAQETIRLSEERFSRIFHSSPIATVLFRLDDRSIQDTNQSFEKLTGYPGADILGRTDRDFDLTVGKDRKFLLDQFTAETPISGLEAHLISRAGIEHTLLLSLEHVVINDTTCVIAMMQDITELQETSRHIQQQEQYFRSLIENSSDITLVFDKNLHLSYVSPSCRKKLGYEPEALLGSNGIPFIHPDDDVLVRDILDRILHSADDSLRLDRIRTIRQDGAIRFLEATFTSLFHDNFISGLVVNCRDITERCLAEEELQEINLRLRATFEQAAVGIAHVDRDGRWLRVNRKLCDITGYSREELLTLKFQEITHPDDLEPDLGLAFQLYNGDIPSYILQKRYRHKNGSFVWVNLTVSAVRDRQNNFKFYIAVIEDISQRPVTEQPAGASEHSFQVMADALPVMLRRLDVEKAGVFFNTNWLEFTGRTADQELGNGWLDLLHPDDAEHCLLTYTSGFDTQQPIRLEYRMRRRDGEYRSLLDHSAPYYSNGSFAGYLSVCVDITETREMTLYTPDTMHALQYQSRLHTVLLSAINRELRTPLHNIVGFAYLLEQELAATEHQTYAHMIHSSARLLSKTLGNIISLVQLESGTFNDTRLEMVLQNEVLLAVEAIRQDAREKNLTLQYEPAEEHLVLCASQSLLHQVLDNLLDNAVKFTHQGTITVRVRGEQQEGQTFGVVEIEDTGVGIAPDFLPYIFDEYTQEPQDSNSVQTGIGLGLTLVKKAVEQINASARVRSIKHSGSIFSIRIPTLE
jgi:PAS domain S-box-containing protein